MRAPHRILTHPLSFWLALAAPGVAMIYGLVFGASSAERLLDPTGEFAARFMIAAMMLTPLRALFPRSEPLRWLAARRRALGVAAFGYAAFHTLLYVADMQTVRAMLAELGAPGIWTGWAALAIIVPLAATSNEAALRALAGWWKRLHRWVYAAAVLTLLHWILVHNSWGAALAHFAPLALLEACRIVKTARFRKAAAVGWARPPQRHAPPHPSQRERPT